MISQLPAELDLGFKHIPPARRSWVWHTLASLLGAHPSLGCGWQLQRISFSPSWVASLQWGLQSSQWWGKLRRGAHYRISLVRKAVNRRRILNELVLRTHTSFYIFQHLRRRIFSRYCAYMQMLSLSPRRVILQHTPNQLSRFLVDLSTGFSAGKAPGSVRLSQWLGNN